MLFPRDLLTFRTNIAHESSSLTSSNNQFDIGRNFTMILSFPRLASRTAKKFHTSSMRAQASLSRCPLDHANSECLFTLKYAKHGKYATCINKKLPQF